VQKLPSDTRQATNALVVEAKAHGKILGGFIGVLWLIQIVNSVFFNGHLTQLGVEPRTLSGLWGILFAPFIHASFTHLIANTIPLAVLGWFVMLRQKRDLITVSVLAALVGGLGTWLIAPALTVHIGASVLVFGYLGYLLFRGIFERRFWPIVGSVVTFFLYGGALFGVMPGQIGISWQGHLFGLIGGILAARLLSQQQAATAPLPQSPARRRIPAIGGPRVRVPAAAEDDAELEAELAAAKKRSRL
jgi:membrane associated rhomboid family serine protease